MLVPVALVVMVVVVVATSSCTQSSLSSSVRCWSRRGWWSCRPATCLLSLTSRRNRRPRRRFHRRPRSRCLRRFRRRPRSFRLGCTLCTICCFRGLAPRRPSLSHGHFRPWVVGSWMAAAAPALRQKRQLVSLSPIDIGGHPCRTGSLRDGLCSLLERNTG